MASLGVSEAITETSGAGLEGDTAQLLDVPGEHMGAVTTERLSPQMPPDPA